MKTKVGLWIDHRKAIVVAITDKGEQKGLIIFAIERQARRSPRSRSKGPFEPQHVPRTIAGSDPSRDISTFTTMRSSRAFMMHNPS